MDSVLTALRNHFHAENRCFCQGKMTPKEGNSKSQFEIRFKRDRSETIWRVTIDGCLIRSENCEKCDYAFYRKIYNAFILVELKGNDVAKAISQLRSTINQFNQVPSISINDKWSAFVVPSRVVPKSRSDIQKEKKAFLRDFGFGLTIKNRNATLSLP